uniref:ABC1 atypical kinase-like domain-containing protein n=1 Tax=Dunaliella tertiolecta TaxID=3047 RepID=A0A7S3R8G9_DUNTE
MGLLWNLLQAITLASHPALQQQQQPHEGLLPTVTARIRCLLAPLAWPLLAMRAAGVGLRVLQPDLSRSMKVWRHIMPIFSMYMWTDWSTKLGRRMGKIGQTQVDARWEARHRWGGKRVFNLIKQVQGYYVKTGQILASKREFIPAAWAEELGCLWDSTPPTRSGWRDVAKAIESSLRGCPAVVRLVAGQGPSIGPEATQVLELVPGKGPHANVSAQEKDQTFISSQSSCCREVGGSGRAEGASCRAEVQQSSESESLFRRLFLWPWNNSSSSDSSCQGQVESSLPKLQQPPHAGELSQELGWRAWTFSWFTSTSSQCTLAQQQQQQQQQEQEHQQQEALRVHDTSCRKLRYVPKHLGHVFARVDATPIASASIAQVHSAELRPEVLQWLGPWAHGREVVIKIQHQHVRRLISTDLRNMERIAKFLGPTLPFDLLPVVQEMKRVVPLECDFEREERLMSTIRARLAVSQTGICVPQAVQQLCGPNMIVMQRMKGQSLTSLLSGAAAGSQTARSAGVRCLLPVLRAYGQMMLVDGLFHADPHPGNMLLQDDGRVALLDWGQVKALSAEERRTLCHLYHSLAKKDVRGALKAAGSFGLDIGSHAEELKHLSLAAKGQQALKLLTIMFDTRYVPEGSSYSYKGNAIVEGAPLNKFPGDLYLICRAVFILRGLCNILGITDLSIVEMWGPVAASGLKQPASMSEARAAENAALTVSHC